MEAKLAVLSKSGVVGVLFDFDLRVLLFRFLKCPFYPLFN